jgi:cytochrome c oxidase cbb3-type subunit 3
MTHAVGLRMCTAAAVAIIAVAGCQRETRRFDPPVMATGAQPPVPLTVLSPAGVPLSRRDESPYQKNAYGISEGKRLYSAMNCNGCHANGGGGIGPALMDDQWIYGSSPDQLFSTIVQGRPDGMPSFSGTLTTDQVWQLVAYIQSLDAGTPRDAATSRSDDMAVMKPELRLERLSPRQTGHR